MPEAEFWACTPRYFAARQKAYIDNQRRRWEQARFTGWLSVLPHVSEKYSNLRTTDLYLFEWDEAPKPAVPRKLDAAEMEALKKFEEDAKKIFEKQFGVKFESPANPTPVPSPKMDG